MAIKLGENNYGKSRVRLLRVVRQEGRHDIRELTLGISFEGDFETAHTKGDNHKILPTDTMKNTVYVLARQYPVDSVEDFCTHLMEHFLNLQSAGNARANRSGGKYLGAGFRSAASRTPPHFCAAGRTDARRSSMPRAKEPLSARALTGWWC